jgi:hypothetical protein
MAQGLDKPIDERPTVRSEIRRGYETGAVCASYRQPADQLDGCISKILTEYRINHSSASAFEVGLNIRKWMMGDRYVQAAERLPGNRLAEDYALSGRISIASARLDLMQRTRELGITFDDAFSAADVIPENRPKDRGQ